MVVSVSLNIYIFLLLVQRKNNFKTWYYYNWDDVNIIMYVCILKNASEKMFAEHVRVSNKQSDIIASFILSISIFLIKETLKS